MTYDLWRHVQVMIPAIAYWQYKLVNSELFYEKSF